MSDIGAITYTNAFSVSQSDTVNDPAGVFVGLMATTAAGLAKVYTLGGGTATIYLALGAIVPLAGYRVFSTTTTATGIVGFRGVPYSKSS